MSKKPYVSPFANLPPPGIFRRIGEQSEAVASQPSAAVPAVKEPALQRAKGALRAVTKKIASKAKRSPVKPSKGKARAAPGRGRPKVAEPRPWEAEGVSRSTWERRQKKV